MATFQEEMLADYFSLREIYHRTDLFDDLEKLDDVREELFQILRCYYGKNGVLWQDDVLRAAMKDERKESEIYRQIAKAICYHHSLSLYSVNGDPVRAICGDCGKDLTEETVRGMLHAKADTLVKRQNTRLTFWQKVGLDGNIFRGMGLLHYADKSLIPPMDLTVAKMKWVERKMVQRERLFGKYLAEYCTKEEAREILDKYRSERNAPIEARLFGKQQ